MEYLQGNCNYVLKSNSSGFVSRSEKFTLITEIDAFSLGLSGNTSYPPAVWVLWGLCCRQASYTSSHIKFKGFQGPHFKISRTLTHIPNKLWIYFDNNQLLLFGATILKIRMWVHTWLSFPQCRFYSAGFKPVFANFFGGLKMFLN